MFLSNLNIEKVMGIFISNFFVVGNGLVNVSIYPSIYTMQVKLFTFVCAIAPLGQREAIAIFVCPLEIRSRLSRTVCCFRQHIKGSSISVGDNACGVCLNGFEDDFWVIAHAEYLVNETIYGCDRFR